MSARPAALFSPRVVVAVLARPRLWVTAFRVIRSHSMSRANGKQRLLPRIARPYLEFRLETQYGQQRDILERDLTMIATGPGESRVSRGRLTSDEVEDVLKYLEWVREWNSRG